MHTRRQKRPTSRRSTGIIAALAIVTMAAGGIIATPVAAEAATRQSVSVTPVIGAERTVQLQVNCRAATRCTGKVALKLSTGGKKTLNYRVASGSKGLLKWKLTTAAYRAFEARGAAKLTVQGIARQPRAQKFTKTATIRPAKPQLTASQRDYAIDTDLKLPVQLNCAASSGCAAQLALQDSSGATILTGKVQSARAGAAPVLLAFTAEQYRALATSPTPYRLRIEENRPATVSSTVSLSLVKLVPVRPKSVAYATRNWVPTQYDTCPAALHESFRTVGPDGKYYPTWHPPQVTDPATGKLCNFGHEHGADPRSSNIYDWVASHFSPVDLTEGEATGIPFGYASEELDNHIHGGNDHLSMRHEDNGGHKFFVRNAVGMVDASHRNIFFTAANGTNTKLVCDFLIKAHQGSWSADATANNAHELIYATKCNDGTELISTTLSLYGEPNEFNRSCAPAISVKTVGSMLPPAATAGGSRDIPDRGCAERAAGGGSDIWALYEVWQSANELTSANGTVLAKFDPWFGLRNPSRYFDERYSSEKENAIGRPVDLLWEPRTAEKAQKLYPWNLIAGSERFDYRDPRSPFNGAQRDFYIGVNTVVGIAGSPTFYTDPYGGNAKQTRTVGAIAQLAVSGLANQSVPLERQQFDVNANWGKNNGVHAPN